MRHLIIAVLSLSTVLAIPSRYPYPVNPGVGAIYKGHHDETIIAGPDGSKITKESDSAGAINLNSPPKAGAIEAAGVAITPDVAVNLANTGPNLFTTGEEIYVNPPGGLVSAGDGLIHQGPAVVNRGNGLVQTAGHIGHDLVQVVPARDGFINAEHAGLGLSAHGHGLAGNAGQAFEGFAREGLAHVGQSVAHAAQAFEGLAHVGQGVAHNAQAFEGLAHGGQGVAHNAQAFEGLAHVGQGVAHNAQAFDGLAHVGQTGPHDAQAFNGLVHVGQSRAHDAQALNGLAHVGQSVAHAAQAFEGLAHVGQGVSHTAQAFNGLAHADQGLIHDGRSFEGFAHAGQSFHNANNLIHTSGHGLIDAGQVLADATAAAGDALVHSINEANAIIHSAQPPVAISPPAVINTAAPVLLAEHPIVVPDVHEHDPKIVEEHVLVGNKIITVPKKVEEDSDLIGPSGTISTRGGDTVISGPSSITIKGDGVVSEIDKQPDVHLKSVEVKPVIPPVVIKPIAPIATVEHTVVSTPVITEARPILSSENTIYAETAPVLGINPIVQTKLIDGLNPILSHKPAIIKSGPVLATSFANHNAVFGNPLYAPEFLPFPVKPFPIKPFYGPLH